MEFETFISNAAIQNADPELPLEVLNLHGDDLMLMTGGIPRDSGSMSLSKRLSSE
jgi:hypothetical protein